MRLFAVVGGCLALLGIAFSTNLVQVNLLCGFSLLFCTTIIPKNGGSLKVLSIDRISTKNQDPKSNDDQFAQNQQ